MADLTPQEMAGKLMAESFSRDGPVAQALSDPIAETPMIVTLDELFPYELDPRLTRNPLYDQIKASVRERGLDAPLTITRRPGATHYIILSGGNTRLAILRELWSETRDERFFRLLCLFRPWPERGEIIALTGHLSENELRGNLTFIERALAVEKARELYEQESGKPLSQSELARRLSADGYPIQQSHISRMQDTVHYLLPCIPNVLYNGLGRHQVERLAVLRRAAEFSWQACAAGKSLAIDFETLFHDALAIFDEQPGAFAVARFRDELIGQMAEILGIDYNALDLEIDGTEHRQRAVISPPSTRAETATGRVENTPKRLSAPPQGGGAEVKRSAKTPSTPPSPSDEQEQTPTSPLGSDSATHLREHIVSPATTTERLEAIQHLVAEHTGEPLPAFADNVLQSIPVQACGLFPISDVWYIEPGLDSPDRLRVHIAQFAQEIAEEAELAEYIEALDTGIGFACRPSQQAKLPSAFGCGVLALLSALSVHSSIEQGELPRDDSLGTLLLGSDRRGMGTPRRLSDNGLVKLFRLARLARRLLDLEANPDNTAH